MDNNIIILRNVYGKVAQQYIINPCPDYTGRYPDHVKTVTSMGDMVLSESEKEKQASGKAYYIPRDAEIEITDGTTFDLSDLYQKAKWEAIKNSRLIAVSRDQTDAQGNLVIDGDSKRYGMADFYVEYPGQQAKVKTDKRRLINQAETFIFQDSQESRITKCKLLGKDMRSAYPVDIEDYLLEIASRTPQRIIDIYAGTDTESRMLFIDAVDRNVIIKKNGVFMYGDTIPLGVTDEAVIIWFKQVSNTKVADMIRQETYPEMYKKDKSKNKE